VPKLQSQMSSGQLLPAILLVCLMPLLLANVSWAAPHPLKFEEPQKRGVITGGLAADEFTLVSIRKESRLKGTERWVFQYGDRLGKPLERVTGFFHISIDRNSKRIVLDFAQVNRLGFNQEALDKLTNGSALVASAAMSMDPHDQSTNMVFSLKRAAAIRVLREEMEKGRLVVEIVPANDVGSSQ
jgi:hypothetical protein